MPAEPSFDPGRILVTLERHDVDYVLVGGLGARAHGAARPTNDIDFVPESSDENLERLAAALRDLGGRLRVGGMSDEEARQLPVQLDAATLRAFGSSTWMTDAGPIDILRELRDRRGGDVRFDDLKRRSVDQEIGGVLVHVAALDDIIEAKEHDSWQRPPLIDGRSDPTLRAVPPPAQRTARTALVRRRPGRRHRPRRARPGRGPRPAPRERCQDREITTNDPDRPVNVRRPWRPPLAAARGAPRRRGRRPAAHLPRSAPHGRDRT